jgi:hypothetical protein
MVFWKIEDITCTTFGTSLLTTLKKTPWNGFIDLGRELLGYFWIFRCNLKLGTKFISNKLLFLVIHIIHKTIK